jgi:hypothetical protein
MADFMPSVIGARREGVDSRDICGSFLTMIEQVTRRVARDRQFDDDCCGRRRIGTAAALIPVARGDDATG